MTKDSERFAHCLADLLTGVQVISDMVILTPTRHLVQGLSFERTARKNYYYLWQLCVPLFSPMMTNLSLNCSHRMDFRGAPGPVFINGECGELAHDVAATFHSIPQDRSARDGEIRDFLRLADGMGEIRSNMMLETSIACGIIGDFDGARRRLNQVLSLRGASPILPRVQETAKEVLIAIDLQNGNFARLVQTWKSRNIQAHFPGLSTLELVPPL